MKKSTSLKISLTCSVLAIGISLAVIMYNCWWWEIVSENVCRLVTYLLGIATGLAVIFIWRKNIEEDED